MENKFKHWQENETQLLIRLYLKKKPLQEIYSHFPHYDYRRVYNKLTILFPENFKRIKKDKAQEELHPIDYGKIRISVIEIAKNKLGNRVSEIAGSYYLDGKRCLAQELIKASKE